MAQIKKIHEHFHFHKFHISRLNGLILDRLDKWVDSGQVYQVRVKNGSC